MGVGKTTVCRELQKTLPDCVFLDGDWCWDMRPFVVSAETKELVLDNICHCLNNFLRCAQFQNILFCWVLHEQAIIDTILARLDGADCRVVCVSLICDRAALTARLTKDIAEGRRESDILSRSLARLPMYREVSTIQIDTTDQTPRETAESITAI